VEPGAPVREHRGSTKHSHPARPKRRSPVGSRELPSQDHLPFEGMGAGRGTIENDPGGDPLTHAVVAIPRELACVATLEGLNQATLNIEDVDAKGLRLPRSLKAELQRGGTTAAAHDHSLSMRGLLDFDWERTRPAGTAATATASASRSDERHCRAHALG